MKTLPQEKVWELEANILAIEETPEYDRMEEEKKQLAELKRQLDYDIRMKKFIAMGFKLVIGGKKN